MQISDFLIILLKNVQIKANEDKKNRVIVGISIQQFDLFTQIDDINIYMKQKQIKFRSSFSSCFSNLRLRTQVLILQIIYLVIITTCLTCLTLIIQKNIINTIAIDSQQVLTQKEMNRISDNYLYQFIQQINNGFFQRAQSLNAINSLYFVAQDKNLKFQQNLDICQTFVSNLELMQQIETSYCFCYGLAGDPNQQYEDKLRLSNILSITSTIQSNYTQLYYSSNTDDQFYTFKPCQNVPSAWIPKQRPWYQQHNQSNLEIQYTSAYIDYGGGVCLTQTKSLTNEQNISIGIIANDMTMAQFSTFTYNQIAEFLLIDFKGQILLSNHYVKGQEIVDYFQNVSKTGFNETDFNILLNYQQNNSYTDLCQIHINNTFCLFDKLRQKLFYFKLGLIMNNKYIVVAKFDPFLYSSAMNSLLQEINDKNDQMATLLIGMIILAFFIFFISFIVTTLVLQRPIEQLMYYSNRSNKTGKFLQTQFPKIQMGTNIGELNLAFFNLLNQQRSNKKDCQERNKQLSQETYQYQKNINCMYLNIPDKIFQNLLNLNYPILFNCQKRLMLRREQIIIFNFIRMINYKIYRFGEYKSETNLNNC
ncbi:unnamed protein product [Paramecium octaurelia]|uniref:Uncharacterized protein n=1 Tax=Paramecium octaurelia TaxID=43137 RepID=A0A8S1TAP1_PAROT|nr:unnamed protein product [Paramecium octaurelia]